MSIFKAFNSIFVKNASHPQHHHHQQHQHYHQQQQQQQQQNHTRIISKASIEASSQPQLTTFQTSWSIIRSALSSPRHRHQQLESTSIKERLELMWDCLAFENSIPITNSNLPHILTQAGKTPECIEYFLENDVPGSLVALSLPDQPVGVKGLVIKFFLSLVVFMDEKFVVNAKVHKPLVRLLRSCVEPELNSDEGDLTGWSIDGSADYEEAVVELMCHLCARIKTFPELLLVFIHNRSRSSQSQSTDASTRSSTPQPLPITSSHSRLPSISGVTMPPSQRKSVHFSPVARSPSLSELSAIIADSSSHTNLSSSLSSSIRHTHHESSRISESSLDFIANTFKGDSDMLIFSYLLRFLHREGRTGDLARAGLLFLMELAMGRRSRLPGDASISPQESTPADNISMAFGEWVLDSDFADVLGASLGAAYGLLPSKLVITPRDPSSEDSTGRMVLGGMGIHFSEDLAASPHTVQEKEREERRQRLLIGLGVSGSDEFRTQIDLFLKLIEFAQDVMRNVNPSTLDHYMSPTEILLASKSPKAAYLDTAILPSQKVTLEESLGSQPGPSPAEIVASAVSSSVLFSIRKSFLNGIIYPSLLECSEYDGSAVAVMSYLEATLSLLETDGELSDSVLRFLMAEDDEDLELNAATHLSFNQAEIMQLSSTSHPNHNRRKSDVVSIIHADYKKAKSSRRIGDGLMSDTGIAYFNSLGRFTLKDLLVNNIQSANSPAATAALKLLNVILVRHDRYALILLDIIPDPTATAFPFPHSTEEIDSKPNGVTGRNSSKSDHDDAEETEFVYPVAGVNKHSSENDSEKDDEEFKYPGESEPDKSSSEGDEEFKYPTPIKPTQAIVSSFTPQTQSNVPNRGNDGSHSLKPSLELVRRIHCSPCPTYRAHRDEIEYLSNLIELIAPSSALMKADSVPGSLSTAFSHYLLDAEAQLTGTATFRRGLLFDYVSASVIPIHQPLGDKPRSSNQFNQAVPKHESPLDFIDHPIIRHQLTAEAPLVSSVLESLAKFFVQPPALNLILTGCVATLASCPTRSLEGWMVPISKSEEDEEDGSFDQSILSSFNPRDPIVDYDEGDDRSIDFAVDEYVSQQLRTPKRTTGSSIYDRSNPGQDHRADCLLEVYRHLAEQVAGYRETINGFDKYLKERRQGLIFVENLEDAFDTLSGTISKPEEADKELKFMDQSKSSINNSTITTTGPTTTVESTLPTPVSLPPSLNIKNKETSFFGSLFKSHSKSPSPSIHSSPQPPTRNHQSIDDERINTPDGKIAVKPFSDHYQQTGSIKLTVVPINTPGSIKRRKSNRQSSSPSSSTSLNNLVNHLSDDDDDDDDDDNNQGPETPTKKTLEGKHLLPKFKLDYSSTTSTNLSKFKREQDEEDGGKGIGNKNKHKIFHSSNHHPDLNNDDDDHGHPKTISLSMVLDNAVILEESIKELGAIISARKSLGIDPVRIL